jgi:hypothetical protein
VPDGVILAALGKDRDFTTYVSCWSPSTPAKAADETETASEAEADFHRTPASGETTRAGTRVKFKTLPRYRPVSIAITGCCR